MGKGGFLFAKMPRPCKMTGMNSQEPRTHCIRCGECCLKSSPTLHAKDLAQVVGGSIRLAHLYTIRKGELVSDNVRGRIVPADQEMIKVRDKRDRAGTCIFYTEGEKACSIYEERPAQCAGLKCWDTAEFMELYQSPKLHRQAVIENGVLLGLIEEQEKRCSYAALDDYVRRISEEGEKAVEKVLELLKFDFHLRPFLSQKLGLRIEEMDFFFGRPLIETIVMFGLKVEKQSDGGFLLTRIEKNGVLE
jgi:Fe-S-cluster containining protein